MKTLYVGDIHATVDDLDDCRALMSLISRTVRTYRPDRLVLLGDQYHTHAVVNVEVQSAYLEFFEEMGQLIFDVNLREVVALVGNHDKPGNKNATAHAMQVHSCDDEVTVVDTPVVRDDILFLPYFHDAAAFVAAAQAHPECSTLVCHQTFDGARYEGGFFAKDGIDPSLVPQTKIISGHVHTPMSFGKVQYLGSPRWRIISDANTERYIYLVDDDHVTKIPTTPHLKAIWQLVEVEGEEGTSVESLLETIKVGDKVVVNLQGTRAWCEARKKALCVRSGLRFRAFPTDARQASVKESDGVAVAFAKHLAAYSPKNRTSSEILAKMVQQRAVMGV